jgi:hypothetical protein
MTDTTPNLALPEIIAAQAQKHVTHNEALRDLDALVQLAVIDRDLATPPSTPDDGARWLVPAGASGDWAGHTDHVASWQENGWEFYVPKIGWVAYVVDESQLIAWDGSAWQTANEVLGGASQNMTLLGLGTTADATNPFSAKLNNVLWTGKTVAEGGDGNLRYKLSKESAGNTLSLLFQDNYSGRAEFGLTGDDDFHVKVSADGTTWRDAIVIDRNSGQVTFPQGGGSADLEVTLAELALGVADALNSAQFMGASGNRVADSFDALTYVDVAGASNLDSGTAGLLKNTIIRPDQLPTMTGATTSGVTISASSTATGFDAWKGADKDLATYWQSTGTKVAQWKADFGSAKTIATYAMTTRPANATTAPTAFTLEGSSTGSFAGEQVTLDTQTGLVWAADETKLFTVAAPASYRYYRISITNSGTTVCGFGEVNLNAATIYNNLTVASTVLTATSAPSSAKLVARVKEIDAITLNTDFVASASRDGGTTWSAFALTKRYTGTGYLSIYESGSLSLAAQPLGTSMKWKIAMANNKSVEINDVYLYWS